MIVLARAIGLVAVDTMAVLADLWPWPWMPLANPRWWF